MGFDHGISGSNLISCDMPGEIDLHRTWPCATNVECKKKHDFKFYASSSNRICMNLHQLLPAWLLEDLAALHADILCACICPKQEEIPAYTPMSKWKFENTWCLKVPPGSLSCWILSDLSGHLPAVPPHYGVLLQQLQQLRPTEPPPTIWKSRDYQCQHTIDIYI